MVRVLALVLAIAASPFAVAEATLLLDERYPIEVARSKAGALLHWLDGLAGLSGAGFTGGKTIAAHRGQYLDSYGEPDEEDARHLSAFREVRRRFAERPGPRGPNELTIVIFASGSVAEAAEATALMLPERNHAALFAAMRHFEPHFDLLWQDGARREAFLERSSQRLRARVSSFLVDVAAFFGVEPDGAPIAKVHLFPTPAGHGTHAQAIEDHLLIELRPRETLRQQVAPVVHESCHFMFYRVEAERMARFRALAEARGESGRRAWRVLHEALPTALAQGVAGQRFERGWSFERGWYHRGDVDRYAKALYPLVRKALADDRPLDERLMAEMLDIFVEADGATRRSP